MKEKLNMKFEEALAELEGIVAAMEGGKLPLEEMMKQFERGMVLSRFCSGKLGETEKRIEILVKSASGKDEWQKMSAGEESGAGGDGSFPASNPAGGGQHQASPDPSSGTDHSEKEPKLQESAPPRDELF